MQSKLRVICESSAGRPFQVGDWIFNHEADGWSREDGKGLRRPIDRRAPIWIMAEQGPLPQGIDLDRFVDGQDKQAKSAGLEYVDAKPVEVSGATEAWHSVWKKKLLDDSWLVQRQLTAVDSGRVGIVTVIGPEQECQLFQQPLQYIIEGLEFASKPVPHIQSN